MAKFLHIVYGNRDKRNRVFDMNDTTIEFNPDDWDLRIDIAIHSKKLIFFATALRVRDAITIRDGQFHFNVSGLDRKNKAVEIFTDDNEKKFITESDTEDIIETKLFSVLVAGVELEKYKEI